MTGGKKIVVAWELNDPFHFIFPDWLPECGYLAVPPRENAEEVKAKIAADLEARIKGSRLPHHKVKKLEIEEISE